MDVFSRWKTARAHLHQAVQTFLDVSLELHSATAYGSLFHSRSSELEDLAQKIQDELADDLVIETKLAKSRAMANRTRNMSATRSPVNMLPSELLSRVFFFMVSSNICCALQGKQDPARVMSSVCSRWRQIAITTCSLWSHIHLCVDVRDLKGQECSLKTAELWIERAGVVPLHIHTLPNRNTGGRFSLLPWHVSILGSHLGLVSSIELQDATQSIIKRTLTAISQADTPSTLKYLNVSFQRCAPVVGRVTWPAECFHGLVDLQLSDLPADISPSFDELMRILASSPSLQTLRLTFMEMAAGTPIAVRLPSLRLLDVTYLDLANLAMLLPALTLGNNELDLRVTFDVFSPDSVSALDALVQFAARSNVVSLYLYEIHHSARQFIRRLVSSVPSLRVLVLRDTDYYLRLLKHLVDSEKDNAIVQLPKIHTLVISGCIGPEEAKSRLGGFIDAYPLHTIVLDDCGVVAYEGLDSDDEGFMEEEDIEAQEQIFRDELAERIQSVRITDNIIDGNVRQLDFFMRGLIEESKSCTI